MQCNQSKRPIAMLRNRKLPSVNKITDGATKSNKTIAFLRVPQPASYMLKITFITLHFISSLYILPLHHYILLVFGVDGDVVDVGWLLLFLFLHRRRCSKRCVQQCMQSTQLTIQHIFFLYSFFSFVGFGLLLLKSLFWKLLIS